MTTVNKIPSNSAGSNEHRRSKRKAGVHCEARDSAGDSDKVVGRWVGEGTRERVDRGRRGEGTTWFFLYVLNVGCAYREVADLRHDVDGQRIGQRTNQTQIVAKMRDLRETPPQHIRTHTHT